MDTLFNAVHFVQLSVISKCEHPSVMHVSMKLIGLKDTENIEYNYRIQNTERYVI